MSRIGKKPISIPKNVKVNVKDGVIEVTGPKGTLTTNIPGGISFRVDGDQLIAERESNDYAALHGLARALVQNAVTGVTDGYTRQLDIVGDDVDFRSHVLFDMSEGLGFRSDVRQPRALAFATLLRDAACAACAPIAGPVAHRDC